MAPKEQSMKRNYHPKNSKAEMKKRMSAKSLKAMLTYKFLNEYGYSNGRVTAQAIVEDIIKLVETYFVQQQHLKIGEMPWVAAVKGQAQFYGKNIHNTKKKVITLTVFSQEDLPKEGTEKTKYRQIQVSRLVRWTKEANQQGACLTIEDLSALSLMSIAAVSQELKKHQGENKASLPLRGYLEDIGRGTTHKKQILNLHLQNYLSSDIARMTSHSKDAVDRYINDFQIISMLSKKFDKEIIPVLARKSKTLVNEYLKICRGYQKESANTVASVGVK